MRFLDYIIEYEQKICGKKSAINIAMDNFTKGNLFTQPSNYLWGGKLYTFLYNDTKKHKELKTGKRLFYDYQPYILSLNILPNNKTLVGLNLNILLLNKRFILFNNLINMFGKWDFKNKTFKMPERLPVNHKNINKLINLNSYNAINKYNIDKISNLMEISWNEIPSIFYISSGKLSFATGFNLMQLNKKI